MSESGSTWAVEGRDMVFLRCHFNFTKKIQQPTVTAVVAHKLLAWLLQQISLFARIFDIAVVVRSCRAQNY